MKKRRPRKGKTGLYTRKEIPKEIKQFSEHWEYKYDFNASRTHKKISTAIVYIISDL